MKTFFLLRLHRLSIDRKVINCHRTHSETAKNFSLSFCALIASQLWWCQMNIFINSLDGISKKGIFLCLKEINEFNVVS
jgi:hypothetical protein